MAPGEMRIQGQLSAGRSHERTRATATASQIACYLSNGDKFDRALLEFSDAYAE